MLPVQVLYAVPVISLIGSGRYVYQVLIGKAKPNRVTWFLWALAPMIAFAAQVNKGVGLQSIMTFMVGFGPLLVVIASYVKNDSSWKLTRFDIVCGALSLIGLGLWLVTKQGNIAIFLSIIADALAGLPTLVKSYAKPETESYLVFLFGAVNALLTLLTIDKLTFANAGFAIYIFTLCLVLVALITFKVGPKLRNQRLT